MSGLLSNLSRQAERQLMKGEDVDIEQRTTMLDGEKPPNSVNQRFRGNEYGKRCERIGCLRSLNVINERRFKMGMKPTGEDAEHQNA